ncbi:MAG: hypothetical protein WC758_05180 [Candidatus Woesearchaeota archaeon]|jgi:hypothetical protein
MDESLNTLSLQDKIQLIERMKKFKEAEVKLREEQLTKEIKDLEEKRLKEMKKLEEELKKEEENLDSESAKAMNELFFRERRRYLMNKARVERKAEFLDESSSSNNAPKGESFLYSISERIFAGENMKLRESMSSTLYSGRADAFERRYVSTTSYDDLSSVVSSNYSAGGKVEDNYNTTKEIDPTQYISDGASLLERMDKDLENRRRYGF